MANTAQMVAGYLNGERVAEPITVYEFVARFRKFGDHIADIAKRGEIEVTVPQGTITFKIVS